MLASSSSSLHPSSSSLHPTSPSLQSLLFLTANLPSSLRPSLSFPLPSCVINQSFFLPRVRWLVGRGQRRSGQGAGGRLHGASRLVHQEPPLEGKEAQGTLRDAGGWSGQEHQGVNVQGSSWAAVAFQPISWRDCENVVVLSVLRRTLPKGQEGRSVAIHHLLDSVHGHHRRQGSSRAKVGELLSGGHRAALKPSSASHPRTASSINLFFFT